MRSRIAAVALAVLLVLTGCSTDSDAATPSGELGKITTIDQLVDAAIEAGMVCNWEQTDKVGNAVASGSCSDSTVLMMFEDNAAARAQAEIIYAFSEEAQLVGENWVINSKIGAELQPKLGGELIGGSDDR